jgi:hypothetical protein
VVTIKDDGGDGSEGHVTQNIQALQWYLQHGLKDMTVGSEFQIKLEAFVKGTETKLAASEITIKVDAPTFENSYGNLTHVYGDNQLFAGGGNPSTGFVKSVNEKAGIELGLDARFTYSGSDDLKPSNFATDKDTWHVSKSDLADFRFAYSAAADAGLGKYDFRLSIDKASTAAEDWVFNLGGDTGGNKDINKGGNSLFDWIEDDYPAAIQDDGGNGTVTQNIQALQWYFGGLNNINVGDEFHITLQAFDKNTGTELAGTDITIVIGNEWAVA